ncbi:unnamed protein product [Closterium sp. NIES-54]
MNTLQVLLHIAAQRDYDLHSLDFSTAFLQESLHEQIWLCRLPGFIGTFRPGTQWQLCRPVYGLCQAPREWHDTLHTTLAALDFFPSSVDPSLFVRRSSTRFFVLVYVDDVAFATPDRHALASVKEELQRRQTCTDLGELRRYLGLQITRDRAARTITLTQSHMVEQILTRFCFPFSKVQPTSLAVDHGLTAPPLDEPFESSGPYLELVGCLMYLMTCTHPDLAYPLSVLARFVALGRHQTSYWYAAKRVAKYVASTSGMGLVLGGMAASYTYMSLRLVVGRQHRVAVEDSSCIKDLWQLPIISWNGKPPATATTTAAAKATARGEETAPTDGALDAVKKVQQPQQSHGEVLAGVDETAAWAKALSGSGEADWETWHERLCHVNFPMLQKLVKDGILKGLEVKGAAKETGSCPTCLEKKFTKFPFSSSTGPAKALLALVHIGVVGPTKTLSLTGSRYFLTIVDNHTRAVWVYLLKTKGEAATAILKDWMPRAQKERRQRLFLMTLRAGAYCDGC